MAFLVEILWVHCQHRKIIAPQHTPRREWKALTSPWNANQLSGCSQISLFQKFQKSLTCFLLSSLFMSPRFPHLQEICPKSLSMSIYEPRFYVCLPKAGGLFHTLIWSDKAKFRPRGLGFVTQHTAPTLEAWLSPKTHMTFLRNKVTCTDPPWAQKWNQCSSVQMSWNVVSSTCLIQSNSPKTMRKRCQLTLSAPSHGEQASLKKQRWVEETKSSPAATFSCSFKIKISEAPVSTARWPSLQAEVQRIPPG